MAEMPASPSSLKNSLWQGNDVFSTVNNVPLGDVGQSMTTHMGMGYIAVNNSGKVEVINLANMSSEGTITGLGSPRYVLVINHTTAYVSDMSSGLITAFDHIHWPLAELSQFLVK